MLILKIAIKIVLLPIIALVTLVQWISILFIGVAAWITGTVSSLLGIILIILFVFGELRGKMAIIGFAVTFLIFIFPYIAKWIVCRIIDINYALREMFER